MTVHSSEKNACCRPSSIFSPRRHAYTPRNIMEMQHLDVLRPDSSLADCGPRFGEYPVALPTRRTLGLCADDLLEQRHAAPGSVRLSRSTIPRSARPV